MWCSVRWRSQRLDRALDPYPDDASVQVAALNKRQIDTPPCLDERFDAVALNEQIAGAVDIDFGNHSMNSYLTSAVGSGPENAGSVVEAGPPQTPTDAI